MEVTLHVGPEYSWEVLEKFLKDSRGSLVSAIYEFHAAHIKDAIEARLEDGGSLTLVMDNATFGRVHDSADSFDRVAVFKDWATRFSFERIVVPEGTRGLISDAYHIKVSVRDDDTFWLSSGNWKAGSSQPIVTTTQLDNAVDEDLPGNREWHVIIKHKNARVAVPQSHSSGPSAIGNTRRRRRAAGLDGRDLRRHPDRGGGDPREKAAGPRPETEDHQPRRSRCARCSRLTRKAPSTLRPCLT